MTAPPPAVVVAAVGSEFRRDDGVGPAVVALARPRLGSVRVLGSLASPLALLGAWEGAALAVIVDALVAEGPAGTVHAVEVGPADTVTGGQRAGARRGSHGIGVVDVLRLCRTQGTAPRRVVLIGVAGQDFGHGTGLSPAVAQAVSGAADLVVGVVHEATRWSHCCAGPQ